MTTDNKTLTVGDIAAMVQGNVAGDPSVQISGFCSLEEPEPFSIAFLGGNSKQKLKSLIDSIAVGALFVTPELAAEHPSPPFPLIAVKDPYAGIVAVVRHFYKPPAIPEGVSRKAEVHPSAVIAPGAGIGAFAVIGKNVRIGAGAVIHPHVVIYEGACIGEHTIIHSHASIREHVVIGAFNVIQNGAVIGADGFGYVADPAVGLQPIPQVGVVRTADRVDVGANSCVDRATLGSTRVGFGTKIDNLVQIGHNTSIGMHSILCGKAGVAGSTTIGNRVVLGGAVGIGDHVRITDNVRIAAYGASPSDILHEGDYGGYPAMPADDFKRWYKFMKKTSRKSS